MIKVENLVLGMCGTNCYLLFDDERKEAVIVDPAASPAQIVRLIEKNNVNPVAIVITHGHFDHLLAAEELKNKYGIKIYAGANEKAIMENVHNNLSLDFMGQAVACAADVYFEPGQRLSLAGFEIDTMEVPGHTIGSICYYLPKEGIIFTGDTLFNCSVGRSDFPTGSAGTLIRAIKDKLYVLPEDTVVYAGHNDSTTIGFEKKNNPFV